MKLILVIEKSQSTAEHLYNAHIYRTKIIIAHLYLGPQIAIRLTFSVVEHLRNMQITYGVVRVPGSQM